MVVLRVYIHLVYTCSAVLDNGSNQAKAGGAPETGFLSWAHSFEQAEDREFQQSYHLHSLEEHADYAKGQVLVNERQEVFSRR